MIARHTYCKRFKQNIGIPLLFVIGFLSFSFSPLEEEGTGGRKKLQNSDQIQPVQSSAIEQDQNLVPMFVVDPGAIDLNQSPLIRLPDPAFVMPNAADFRISESGELGVAGFNQAQSPVVAYNMTNRHYLVVWHGDDDPGSKDEIYGRLIDAGNNQILGSSDFRIAEFSGDDDFDLRNPDVVYNSVLNEYLVVWQGVHQSRLTTNTGTPAEEIFGRRVAADGTLLNPDGTPGDSLTGILQISIMGTDDENGYYNGLYPAVEFNSADNGYLVVWQGTDDGAGTHVSEYEIFGQLLKFTGNTLATSGDNFQISDVAGDNYTSTNDANKPDIVFNATESEYFVVWEGEEGNAGEPEIYGQRLNGDGVLIDLPAHNFRISNTPAPGNEARDASVAWNFTDNQYMVAWCGEGSGVTNEFDVFGKILNSDGTAPATGDEFRVSDMGPDGSNLYRAFRPRVAYRLV